MIRLMIMRAGDTFVGALLGALTVGVLGFYGVVPAPVTAAEPMVPVVPVQTTRDHVAAADSPFYGVLVADDDVSGDALPELDAPATVEYAAYLAMIDAGARGAMNDRASAVYMRVGTVLDFDFGTVTVTQYGPALCVDDETRCSGSEFLTDSYVPVV